MLRCVEELVHALRLLQEPGGAGLNGREQQSIVFVRGHDYQLAQKRWNGEDWSEWRDLGGHLTSSPAVSSWGSNRLDVFIRGEDSRLKHKRWNGEEWSEWRDLGGRQTSAPAAVSWGPNRIDVFVRGHDFQLAQKRWNGEEWSEWRNLDGD